MNSLITMLSVGAFGINARLLQSLVFCISLRMRRTFCSVCSTKGIYLMFKTLLSLQLFDILLQIV